MVHKSHAAMRVNFGQKTFALQKGKIQGHMPTYGRRISSYEMGCFHP